MTTLLADARLAKIESPCAHETSRRALIGGAGLAVAALAASALAATASPVAVDGISPALVALIADAGALDEAGDRHQRLVVDKAVGDAAISAAIDENNALNDAYADALDAVALHPVSTVADLRAKLAFMSKHQMGDGRNWLDEISADVLRIASAEGR